MSKTRAAAAAPLRVAVLAGGRSSEREISLKSGIAVAHALLGRRHQATMIDPAARALESIPWDQFDAAFIALHGRFGEDGQVQELLERAGVVYTGSSAETSRLAFSKSASKERFAQCGVPTPPYVLIHETDRAARIEQQARALGFPLVVKPDGEGSSLGVSIVERPEELPQALTRCFHHDAFGILEAAVIGSEWTLGMLDDEPLPLIQIETSRPFYDFQAKYEDDATVYRFEFALPSQVVETIAAAARSAAQALGTRGIARVDLRVDKWNRPWVLEVNTVPGFTDHSLVPKAAARIGLDLGALCERELRRAIAAHRMAAAML
ncbi:MAG: D-alanine--D-alanine ligase [Planctomycetes bacterium]|nr:D-alanine--D-alanine ligase [Planctomycetota bacterium]